MSSIYQSVENQRIKTLNNTPETNFSFNHGNIQSPSINATGDIRTIHKLIVSPSSTAQFQQVQNMTRTLYEGHLTKTEGDKLKSQIDFLKKELLFFLFVVFHSLVILRS